MSFPIDTRSYRAASPSSDEFFLLLLFVYFFFFCHLPSSGKPITPSSFPPFSPFFFSLTFALGLQAHHPTSSFPLVLFSLSHSPWALGTCLYGKSYEFFSRFFFLSFSFFFSLLWALGTWLYVTRSWWPSPSPPFRSFFLFFFFLCHSPWSGRPIILRNSFMVALSFSTCAASFCCPVVSQAQKQNLESQLYSGFIQ